MNQTEEIPITFKVFSERHKYPSIDALRKMAFESEHNGMKAAFLKFGRRRLVLPETLFRLIRKKGSEG